MSCKTTIWKIPILVFCFSVTLLLFPIANLRGQVNRGNDEVLTSSPHAKKTIAAGKGLEKVASAATHRAGLCPDFKERVYAETQTWGSLLTGFVSNNNKAIDGNPQTFSTITCGLAALGVGTTWQTLQWNNTISAGTPITVKLGNQYSGVELIGAVSVVGTKRNGIGVPIDIGVIQPLSGGLVSLLPGESTYEFTFTPSDASGDRPYDGVRIIVGSALAVAQNINVYEAYFERDASPLVCSPGDVEDVFYGVYDIGVGTLTSTTSVANPWNSVDADDATFATMYNGVGVASESRLTVKFRTPSQTTDILRFKLKKSGTPLGVVAGFSVQRYMGNVPVGPPLSVSGSTASVIPVNGNDEVIFSSVGPSPAPFDRVMIRLGGVANVLDFLQVHYVKREAAVDLTDSSNTDIAVCQGGQVSLVTDACTTYRWYDAETGGNMISGTSTYTVPGSLAPGTYTFYVQPMRGGCEVLSRTKVTVTVRPASPSTLIPNVLVNSLAQTTFCSPTGSVLLAAQLSSTPSVTNPIYYWYSFDGTNQVLIPGQNSSTLQLNGMAPGTYTYYVGVSATEFCETLQPNRTPITFTILPFSTANDITINDVQVCQGNSIVLQPTSSLINTQYNWYYTNGTSMPITNGTFNGITYLIGSNGSLTISGLTTANNPYTYYVSVQSDTTCQNVTGTLQDVTIQVNTTPAPTTNNATQNFCQTANPTVASLQTIETGVTWYDAASGGNVVPSTTALVNGMTYYASITNAVTGCSSLTRLAVLVNVNVTPTPTTNNTTQNFCQTNNPTVASLQTNETGVIWYDAASGGNVVPSTTALVNGMTYYAGMTNATTGCSSSSRLAVTVNLNTTPTPTTTSASQNFCQATNPTVASLQTNETGVIWYDAASAGNVVSSTTPLVNGMTYYAGITDSVTGCSSSPRLAVTVTINVTPTPTTNDTTQDFCQSTNPTVASLQTNETGVIWYDAANGGNVIPSTTALVNGMTYYASITNSITGCASGSRLAVSVNVNVTPTPTTNNTTQNFCQTNNPTVASLQTNETGVIWYDAASAGNVVPSTTALVNGMTYYAGMTNATTGCSSSSRLAVTVNLNTTPTPTTTSTSQNFCQSANPTVASLQTNETGVIWYDTANAGNVVSSTTPLVNGTTYYGGITDSVTGCSSSPRLAVTVTINVTPTPTTNDTTQDFCQSANPTVASLQTNESGVIWYDAPNGGNIIPSTTALTDGMIYYASSTNSVTGCTSGSRLAVSANINVTPPPTTNDTTQDFCQTANPTVASLQVNETGVVWYDAATGGNVIPSTTALVNGMTYYAGMTDAATGCSSVTRLTITVTLNVTPPPTTNNTTQNFCVTANPTVASLQTNETGVIWYDAPSGGNMVSSTTPLVNGMTYYAGSINTVTGCPSSSRLAVTAVLNSTPTPTTNDTTQDFCQSANPTVAALQVNEAGVVWYDAPSGGNVVPSTTALTDGMIYYAAIVNPVTGCSSSTLLAVAANLNVTPSPTTNDTTQEFCPATNPTGASLQVNETGVIWYDAPTGGNIITATTPLTDGMVYYAELTNATTGCTSSRLAVTVSLPTIQTATLTGGSATTCIQSTVTYTTDANMSNYAWTLTSGGQIVSGGGANDSTITILWNQLGANTVAVSYTNVAVCNAVGSATYNLTVETCAENNNLVISKTVNNPTPFIDENVVFTITVTNNGVGQYTNIFVNEVLPSGYAFVSSTVSTGSYNATNGQWSIPVLNGNETATLQITATVLFAGDYLNTATIVSSTPEDPVDGNVATATIDPLCLIVYNEFTPNEDGSNDVFTIKCAEYYPNNKLEVYNRYGNLVFKTKGYKNDWKGMSNVSGTIGGNELPTGTYYYVFETGEASNQTKSGWLYIMR